MDWKTESQLRSELSEVWKLLDAERVHTRFVIKQRDELLAALERINRWHGEFPPSGRYWDTPHNTLPMSFSACNGSNGERDYMRDVARAAIASVKGNP